MKNVILAPHIDDELIGCYSVISRHIQAKKIGHPSSLHVLYFHDLTPERMQEASKFAEQGEFYVTFGPFKEVVHSACSGALNVYVPHRKDAHIHHKGLNCMYRELATKFYSVDMVGARPLGHEDAQEKKAMLDKYYPSQSKLWERDEKYFLFESIRDHDYEMYSTIRLNNYEVTMLSTYTDVVTEIMRSFGVEKQIYTPRQIFDKILKVCRDGTVEFICPRTKQIFRA